jgi:hypothetical protein
LANSGRESSDGVSFKQKPGEAPLPQRRACSFLLLAGRATGEDHL